MKKGSGTVDTRFSFEYLDEWMYDSFSAHNSKALKPIGNNFTS